MPGEGRNFARQRPYRPIKASTINDPAAAGERMARLGVGRRLARLDIAGTPHIRSTEPKKQKARIVGLIAPGVYRWQGVFRDPTTGAIADLESTVSDNDQSDPAYEDNSLSSVPIGWIVTLERSTFTGEWTFQLATCGS